MLLGDMDPILKSYIIKAIRQAFVRSKAYKECKTRNRREYPRLKKDGTVSKVKDVRYRCETCLKEFKEGEFDIDHKLQVVNLYETTNNMSIQLYISRVFCKAINLQLLCKGCHKDKTDRENKTRRSLKKHKFPKKKIKKPKF